MYSLAAMTEPAILVEDLRKRYGDVEALAGMAAALFGLAAARFRWE